MKLLQKSLLFASLLAIGTSATTIPAIISSGNVTVQAASVKNLKAGNFYYRIGKNRLIKATDVKILTNDNQTDSNMDQTAEADNFRLEVTSSKAQLYNQKGKKLARKLSKGDICKIGSQDAFDKSTYYKQSNGKIISVTDTSTL